MVSADKLNRMIGTVREKIEALDDADAVKKLDDGMAIDFSEHHAYQNMQAEAHVSGLISPGAAQIMYVALGEVGSDSNGGWAEGTDTATKCVVTQFMAEFVSRKIKTKTTV